MTASAERLMEIENFSDDSENQALDIDAVQKYYADRLRSFGLRNTDFTYYPAVDSIKDLSKDNQPIVLKISVLRSARVNM